MNLMKFSLEYLQRSELVMSISESNLSTHECEWCGIRTPDVRSACMACGTQTGLPNLDAGSFVDSDPIVKTAYLNGAFSDIASRIHSNRIRWTHNVIAQQAIFIALLSWRNIPFSKNEGSK